MRRYSEYDPFAWLYTNYWGDDYHREAIPVLDRLILKLLPRKASILDLCCGDGRITQTLAKRGYDVSGLDGSERMLTFAKQRVSRAEFFLADARRFKLPRSFDAVISTFDSLNHLMALEEVQQVFNNVAAALKPCGYFAFDLNREEAYMDLWSRTSTIVDKKCVSVARGRYDSARKLAVCDVTLMRLDNGNWQRSDFRMAQRCYARDEILAALAAAGFEASVFDASRQLGMQGDIGEGRDFYLAYLPETRDASGTIT